MNTVQGTREYLLKYDIKPSMQRIAIMDYFDGTPGTSDG